MKPSEIIFNIEVDKIISNTAERCKVVQIALALMLSSKAAIPTLPVEDISLHYRTVICPVVTDIVAKVNEITVINYKEVLKLIESLYMIRYNAMYGEVCSNVLLGATGACFFTGYFNINKFIPGDVKEAANQHAPCIYKILPLLEGVLKDDQNGNG